MSPPDLDRLLENARWVRALGIELAGAARGEDVAQDAWLAALESPGGARNPAAWLAGAVRRLAGRARRTDERRTRRERAAARPEAQAGPDELVAEAELSRALIRAVTELDEPFRATVLLRFYRGCTAEEIAASQGVPAATVRTRLHRALGKLRERLDREQGGRSAWALAFATPGMAAASPLATTTIQGGTLMGVKAWAGGALALAAVVGVVLTRGRDDSRTDSARNGSRAERGAPAEALLPPEPGREPAEARREVAAAAPAAGVTEVLVYGAVADPTGKPVALEFLGLEDAQGVVRSASRPEAGSFALAGLAPGRYALSARADGFLTRREELVVRPEAERQRHDVVLAPALSIPVKILDETGGRWKESSHEMRMGGPRLVVTALAPEEGLAALGGGLDAIHGCGKVLWSDEGDVPRGYSGLLRLRVPPPVFVSLLVQDSILETRRLDGSEPELVFTYDRERFRAQLGGVAVRFVDALSGSPLTGGQAGLDPPNSFSHGGTPVAADGTTRLEGRAPGLYTLRYFDLTRAQVNRRVRVQPGTVLELGDVPVWPRATIRGTVLDARGQPATASLYWAALSELSGPADLRLGSFRRTNGGRLEADDVARGPVRLFVSLPEHALLARTVDASSGLVEGLVLQLEAGQPLVLRAPESWAGRQATVFDPEGLPLDTWTLGAYTVRTRLAPGRYALGLGRAERVETRRELVVAGEPLVLDLSQWAR